MCHPLAMAIFDSPEDPIALFKDHAVELLESALSNPKQTYGEKELYPTLEEKAAILYYCLIKNHPFKNGNKRLATMSLLVFLHINGFWLIGDRKETEDYLVELAKKVAETKGSENKEEILEGLRLWLEKHVALEKNKFKNP